MTDQSFKPGDVVQLPTTGPHMTVEEVDRGQCFCVWFEGRTVRRDNFPAACLRPAQERNGPMARAL